MSEFSAVASFLLYSVGFLVVGGALRRVIKEGPAEIERLKRSKFGVRALINGDVGKSESGSTIDVLEGFDVVVNNGRLKKYVATRAVSREVA